MIRSRSVAAKAAVRRRAGGLARVARCAIAVLLALAVLGASPLTLLAARAAAAAAIATPSCSCPHRDATERKACLCCHHDGDRENEPSTASCGSSLPFPIIAPMPSDTRVPEPILVGFAAESIVIQLAGNATTSELERPPQA